MTALQPLAPSSPKLARHRFQADVCGPRNDKGGRLTIATGRFTAQRDAQAWADAEHPDAELVLITYYAATSGWRPHASGRRTAGTWEAE